MTENWKDIKGFEGLYQISNLGRVKSFKSNKKGRILSVKNCKGWYLQIRLIGPNKVKSEKLHRLVAKHFIPNPYNKPHINHKDGNKQNNRADNLEWVTPSENCKHAVKNNPDMIKGMNNYNKYIRPKPIKQLTLEGDLIAKYPNATEASRQTGVCYKNILQVARKEEYKPGKTRKQAGGFIWEYVEEGAKNAI